MVRNPSRQLGKKDPHSCGRPGLTITIVAILMPKDPQKDLAKLGAALNGTANGAAKGTAGTPIRLGVDCD